MSLIITMKTRGGQRFLVGDTQAIGSDGDIFDVGPKMSLVRGAMVGSVGRVGPSVLLPLVPGPDIEASVASVALFAVDVLIYQRDTTGGDEDSKELDGGMLVCVERSAFLVSPHLDVLDVTDLPFTAIGVAYAHAEGYLQACIERDGEPDWRTALSLLCKTIRWVGATNAYVGSDARGYAYDGHDWVEVCSG